MAQEKKRLLIKKHHIAIGTVILLVLLGILFLGTVKYGLFAAQGEVVNTKILTIDKDNQIVYYPYFSLYSDEVTMGDIVLATEYAEGYLAVNDTFEKESPIYFILANATGFDVNPDGSSQYDVDVDIAREDGTVVYSEDNVLGDKGKIYLKSNIITPYGTIEIPSVAKPGLYTLTIVLHDLVSGESVERSTEFTVLGEEVEIPEPVFTA